MNSNVNLSDRAGILAALNPVSQSAGTSSTSWISMANYRTMMAIVQVGVLGASATVDAKIEQATSSGGAGAKDVSGKAITQFTKAGSDDNKQAIINVRADDLDMVNGFTHVRLSITVATAASLTAGMLIGADPRTGTAADGDAATVDEIV